MKKLLAIYFIAQTTALWSQSSVKKEHNIIATYQSSGIKVDGILDEDIWSSIEPARDFVMQYPFDTALAVTRTEVKVVYNHNFFYLGVTCYNTHKEYVITSLQRDFEFYGSDAFAVFIDPFQDQTNGYSFAVNPMGVQREGLVVNGGSFGSTTDWDCKWYAETSRGDGFWTVEIAIPLRSLKYRTGDTWRINFARNNPLQNEISVWSAIPRVFSVEALAFTGKLNWGAEPPPQKSAASIIPYATTRFIDDYTDNEKPRLTPGVGLDARITVLKSLNLDLTVNPDFSQVEVDQQVTNLSRFSLFFPERRNFFLENNDLFGLFGFRQIRPFFSRRIGLYAGNTVPILGGARLSGKINRNWRIGFMNMQTEGVGKSGLPAENFTVGAFQRVVGARSNIAGIFVNRQGFAGNHLNYSDYNRLIGLDYNIQSSDNRFRGKLFYHHSFSPGIKNNNYTHASWLMYSDNKWQIMWNHEYVGKNYRADVGFVPRTAHYDPISDLIDYRSYWRLEPDISYNFFPKKGNIQSISPGLYLSSYHNEKFTEFTEYLVQGRTEIILRNTAELSVNINAYMTDLFYPFDVTGLDSTPLTQGKYSWNTALVSFAGDSRKKFTYYTQAEYGTYYNGTQLALYIEAGYRIQPFGSISLSVTYNNITLPEPYPTANLWLMGPRISLAFTRSVFFSTFIQYNTQIQNLNINSRIQWRFKPMSDLFIVYTDNYDSRYMAIRNRALVVKLSYWFN